MKKLQVVLLSLLLAGAAYQLGKNGLGGTTQCSRKMKSVCTYLEMYATDHSGRYPEALLAEHRCPQGGEPYEYSSQARPDRYRLRCTGKHYAGSGFREGYPYYSSSEGWCMAPDHFTSQTPEDYLWLNDNPKL